MKMIPITIATSFALLAGPAFSAGSETPTPPKPSETTLKCDKGFVWDKKKKECVEIEESSLSDDAIYDNARELAYAEQYTNALNLLDRAENPRDARILTYKGYAHRRAGRTMKGMSYYRQALRADPNYVLARSYMGQAFIQQGKSAAAKQQLKKIAAISGTDNWPYEALAKAIKGDTSTDY